MPKEYRERIIDEKPVKVLTMHPKRTTTGVNPEETLPAGTYSTAVALSPGDAVLWFLRLATTDSAPTGRKVEIVTTGGGAVSHTYTDQPSGWVNYVTSFYGDTAFDEAGMDYAIDDTIYVIFDQFTGFDAGDYRLSWTLPGTERANVEGAILLHGVATESQGNYYYGPDQTPAWGLNVGGAGGNGFPVSVPTANHSLVYGIWDTTGSISSAMGYTSVPGTLHLSYQYYDPTDPPAVNQSMVSRVGAATGSTLSVSAPTHEGSGGGAGTTYWLNAVVLHSATGITYETVTFDA